VKAFRINKFILILSFLPFISFAQSHLQNGEIHGNFEITTQYYNDDDTIGANQPREQMLMNSFANINYTNGDFSAGLRFESYLNALLGFDPGYNGSGVPYRFVRYKKDDFDITVGSFYEQFGNGLILRSFEERGLGIDNALDGLRVKYNPYKGVYLTGIYGKQRIYFSKGAGIVRGLDADISVNEMFARLDTIKTRLTIGGSFVSKFQEDQMSQLNLPENVAAFAGRFNLSREKVSLMGEYAYKMNDPSADNFYIYKPGQALFLSASFAQKGLGINLSGKIIDNMAFRSDRNEQGINTLTMSYLPALTKQHTYNLAATLYPYATQPRGEVALQSDIIYTIPKGSKLGGKYGTTITINYASAFSPDTVQYYNYTNNLQKDERDTLRMGYKTNFFGIGDTKYFEDFNIEIARKINKKLKMKLLYFYFVYNSEIINPGNPIKLNQYYVGNIYSHITILDAAYKINSKNNIRVEIQNLYTKQDFGSWFTAIVEYTYSPNWFVAFIDQYNYGNTNPDYRFHFPLGTMGYNKGGTRIMLSYGRQKAGIFCVGGVCRQVPASNGLTLTLTNTF
jgi:hypothetical protein